MRGKIPVLCTITAILAWSTVSSAPPRAGDGLDNSSKNGGPTSTSPGASEELSTPSPLDLLYQAADEDLNAISFDKFPSPQGNDAPFADADATTTAQRSSPTTEATPQTTQPSNGQDVTPPRYRPVASFGSHPISTTTTISATLTPEGDIVRSTTEPGAALSSTRSPPSDDQATTALTSTGTRETPATAKDTARPTHSSTAEPLPATVTASSTTESDGRIFPKAWSSTTRRPQVHDQGKHKATAPKDSSTVVDIKTKPDAPKRKTSLRPPVWDSEDEQIEKDIITKIFHGAIRNQERIRNRNLRRLLRRFQVLAYRADLSADEFHKFMRLVSEYTPSRIPTFLLRKSERRQFQEANRVRWQHIRQEMLRHVEGTTRAEIMSGFLRMVERDGALRNRFGNPRRPQINVEEFLRRQAPLMRRILLPPHIEEHPLVRELFGGKRPPSALFFGCCDF